MDVIFTNTPEELQKPTLKDLEFVAIHIKRFENLVISYKTLNKDGFVYGGLNVGPISKSNCALLLIRELKKKYMITHDEYIIYYRGNSSTRELIREQLLEKVVQK